MSKKNELIERLTEQELAVILKQLKVTPSKPKVYEVGDKHIKYGVISDAHIGNKCYDSGLMALAAKEFKREKVEFVLDGGDQCDGFYRDRPGHVFELEHIGADAQVERALEEYSQITVPILGITGNHSNNTFLALSGYDIGKRLEERLDNYTYLGIADGTVSLPYGNKIQIIHPDGGTAYAISYRTQKIIESLEGGTKPGVLHVGHFHKAEFLFYRNIHAVQCGCLEGQTPFMKNKHISAAKGFWIIELTASKHGISSFKPTFYPGY